jgi:hypothetical protein
MRKAFVDIKINNKDARQAAYHSNVKKSGPKNQLRNNLRVIGVAFWNWLRLAMHKDTGAAAKYTTISVNSAGNKYWIRFAPQRIKRDEDPKLQEAIREYEEMKAKGMIDDIPKIVRGRLESYKEYVVDYWYIATGYGGVREELLRLWDDRLANVIWPRWSRDMWALQCWELFGGGDRKESIKLAAAALNLPQKVYVPKYYPTKDPEKILKLLRRKKYFQIISKRLEDRKVQWEHRRATRARLNRMIRADSKYATPQLRKRMVRSIINV